MTIKQNGGVFGRKPTFHTVTAQGSVATDTVAERTSAAGVTVDGLLLKDGNVVPASGKGIDFSATSGTGTSELLDDYEEGTWTPTFQAYDGTATVNSATYVKIGELVVAFFMVTFNGTADASQVSVAVSSLPFSIVSDSSFSAQITFTSQSGVGNRPVRAERSGATQILVMNADESGVTYTTMGTGQLGMVFTYRA